MPLRRQPRSPAARTDELVLPEAELEVLACLHQRGEATAAEIRSHLASFRPMSHASVDTLLQRLMRKARVARRKADRGKAFVYFPRQAGPDLGSAVARLRERVFGGDTVSLVASLFGAQAPTRAELERLKALVDERFEAQREAQSEAQPETQSEVGESDEDA